MSEAKHIDLLIEDDDLVLDEDGQPQTTADKPSIVQDICHAIRESGHLIVMIGERDKEKRGLLEQEIIKVVEEDERIIPGTIEMTADFISRTQIRYFVTADTYEYGTIEATVNESKS